MPQEYRQ